LSVWGGESIYNQVGRLLPPNRAVKIVIDLSTPRNEKSLIQEGLLPANKTFFYLTVLRVGNGIWSFKQVLPDGSTLPYDNTELKDGYLMERRFVDMLFSNSAQNGVTNPIFLIEWVE
jgi:hypothetical protein